MLESVLAGMRVVDLTQNVAGPFCTQILGDLGAEVIKVERPGRGDDTRDWRPPDFNGQSATFLALNRNKKSICVDLANPDGRRIVCDLAASSDVLIHSMKPGSSEKLGLGFDALKTISPRLIYCSISAFGQTGPLRALPGYDPLMQAFTGIMSTTGHEGDDPVRVGVSLIDMGTGMWAALAIMAGLTQRSRTDEGLLVETSLLETGITWMSIFVAGFLATGKVPKKLGSAMAMTAPYELFRCADTHVFIAAGNDGLFARVCRGLGCEVLVTDPRFSGNNARVLNRTELHAEFEAVTTRMQASDVVAALRASGAPCSELHDVSQLLEHEQVHATGLISPLPLDGIPHHQVVGLPIKASGKRSAAMTPPPPLGRDTDVILASIGYDEGRIAGLRRVGAIS
jgi:crotonobetainyl-CoA:carnitine CoA-transferase CaiB-like acyl-CoA transferase